MARYNPIATTYTPTTVSVEEINLEFNKLNQLQHLKKTLNKSNPSNEHYTLIHQSLVKNQLLDGAGIASIESATSEWDHQISLELGIVEGIKKVVGKIIDMIKSIFIGYLNLMETMSFKTAKARTKEAYEWFQKSREYRNQKFTIAIRPSFPAKFEAKAYENYDKLVSTVFRLFDVLDIYTVDGAGADAANAFKRELGEWKTKQGPTIAKLNTKGLPQGVEVDTSAPNSFFTVNSKANERVGEKITVEGSDLLAVLGQVDKGLDTLESCSEKEKELADRKDKYIKTLTKVMNGQEGSDIAIQATRVWTTSFAQYVKLLTITKVVYSDADQVVTRAQADVKKEASKEDKPRTDNNKPNGSFGGYIERKKGLFEH